MDQTAAAGPDPALARAVSADLETIFQPAPAAPEVLRPGRVRSFAAAAVARRERRPAQVGAMVATALAGLALGAFLTKPTSKAEVQPAPQAQQVARIDVPPVTTPPTTTLAATTPLAATPAPTPASPRATEAKVEPKRAAARTSVRKASAERRRSGGYACNGLTRAAEARCAYPQVMAADRSLRAAYDRAVRAGVSRSTLVNYRSRWASLRHRADDQPAKVIYGYRAMARDLDRLSRGSDT
ncbi:hypothetical protein [Phenylobacterium sp.]|uniref:hypothetical protein n=1 Tax=Phenylobacterium sp. TaxID=1871053 RepID=UPI0028115795|nr:hypothetical protein [Phenylobacterium sp.]